MAHVRSLLRVIVAGVLAAGCQDGSSPFLPAARAAPAPGEPLFAAVAQEVTSAPTTAGTAEARHRTLRRLARLLLTTDGASLVDGALAPPDASRLEGLLTTGRARDAAPLLDERLRRLCEAGARSTVRDVRRVSFRGRDGGRRAGLLFVPRRPAAAAAVVWGHGGWVTKEPWADVARELSRTGAYVLALDFQGAGESEGVTSMQGRIDDYVAAMDFLQATLGVTRFGLGGHSGGGAYPAACAAVADERVSALVLWDCMFEMYDAHVAPGCLDPGGAPAAGLEETLTQSRGLPAVLVRDEVHPARGVEGRLDALYEEVEATLARFRHPARLLGDVQQRREIAVLHVVAEELVRQLGPTPRGRTYTLPEVPASPARARLLGRPLRFQESGLFADRYRRWHDELREPKRLVVVPGIDHGFAHPGRGEALRESVRWVQERLVGDEGQPDAFLAVHFEPRSAGARGFEALRELVRLADDHRTPLTLQLTPSWARLILSDPRRLAELRDWQARGHEVAAHHHGARHGWEWDGYTNLPEAEWRQARDRAHTMASPEARRVQELVAQADLGERYLGGAEDAIDLLRRLAGPWPVQTMTMGPDRDADWPTGVPFSLDNIVVAPDGSYTIRGEAVTRPEARTYRGQPVVELSMRFVPDLAGVELAMAEHARATGDDVVGFVTHIEDFAGDPRPVRAWLEYLGRRDPDGRHARAAAAILGRRR